MKPIVLITAIGTITATNIVRELKSLGSFHIIGTDINPASEIATSLDVDEFHQFPPIADTEGYLDYVLRFCKAHGVAYYFAVLDQEVLLISERRAEFERVGTVLCVPNASFVAACHFKNVFTSWIEQWFPDLAIRTYRTVEELEQAQYPLFRKPVEGVASSGCRRIEQARDLAAELELGVLNRDFIIQDCIEGSVVLVDCVRNGLTGQAIQVARRELLRNKNGCGIAVEILHDEALEATCATITEKLNLNGVANIEFFETDAGYKIIEINPRFSAGSAYTCMAGVNTVQSALAIAQGKPCSFGLVDYGARFAERYEVYRMRRGHSR